MRVVVDDNAERSFLAAFDARTGRELWQTGRDDVETYSTPVIWENELRTEIVTQGRFKFRSYGLDGVLLWELPARYRREVRRRRAAPQPHRFRRQQDEAPHDDHA